MDQSLISRLEQVTTLEELEQYRVEVLGKKGLLAAQFAKLKDLKGEERNQFGASLNVFRDRVTAAVTAKEALLRQEAIVRREEDERLDVTAPRPNLARGAYHPISIVIASISDLFLTLGYQVAEGPEVEEEHYNFELMNIPADHPARDMQDTFYFSPATLLRTHTSPVQARTMEAAKGEAIKIICPGKTYRRDEDDATHSHQFSQVEGLVVGHGVTMADLKGTLELLARHLFGPERTIRLRSSFFPFTEPSVEVDVSCHCGGGGCPLCKHTGYIEILGAGMVHPRVLEMSGYDPQVYQGFAFGIGAERVAMLKYGIKDIREFFINDVRMTSQFGEER